VKANLNTRGYVVKGLTIWRPKEGGTYSLATKVKFKGRVQRKAAKKKQTPKKKHRYTWRS